MRLIYGCEIECDVPEENVEYVEKHFETDEDGSLDDGEGELLELRTKPKTKEGIFKDLDKLDGKLYPANETMGFHVHLSGTSRAQTAIFYTEKFSNLAYNVLRGYIRERSKKGEPWEEDDNKRLGRRLRNSPDSFCSFHHPLGKDRIFEQAEGNSERYTYVNFCMEAHGTIEFRAFAASHRPSRMKEYVNVVDNIAKIYLNSMSNQELINTRREVKEILEDMDLLEDRINYRDY